MNSTKMIVILLILFATTVGIVFVVNKKISQEVDQFVITKPVQNSGDSIEGRKSRRPKSQAKPIVINPETDFLKPIEKKKAPVPKEKKKSDSTPVFEPPTEEIHLVF